MGLDAQHRRVVAGLSHLDAWPLYGLDDDLRPRMADLIKDGRAFALATVFAADGGPRGVGAQMVVTDQDSWGFVSGGCVEADVALHGRQTLIDGEPRHLVYGRGSPWIDIRLPCGGRLDLLVERIEPGDGAVQALVAAHDGRIAVRYRSDGVRRSCGPDEGASDGQTVDVAFAPPQKLVVIGSDPIALAAAALGARMGWRALLVWPGGPADPPPGLGVAYSRAAPAEAIEAQAPDRWTAIAVATHDLDQDEQAIRAALETPAGYIGVLGARRRIPDRLERLRRAGIDEAALARLHMPIGLPIKAAAPWEIAVSIASQIIAARHDG